MSSFIYARLTVEELEEILGFPAERAAFRIERTALREQLAALLQERGDVVAHLTADLATACRERDGAYLARDEAQRLHRAALQKDATSVPSATPPTTVPHPVVRPYPVPTRPR